MSLRCLRIRVLRVLSSTTTYSSNSSFSFRADYSILFRVSSNLTTSAFNFNPRFMCLISYNCLFSSSFLRYSSCFILRTRVEEISTLGRTRTSLKLIFNSLSSGGFAECRFFSKWAFFTPETTYNIDSSVYAHSFMREMWWSGRAESKSKVATFRSADSWRLSKRRSVSFIFFKFLGSKIKAADCFL